MLIDEAKVVFKAGKGGPGRVSFWHPPTGGPDGGNGGRGGNVIVKVTSDLTALNRFSREKLIEAENGEPGGKNKKSGRDGRDIEVILPIGTSIVDENSGQEIELKSFEQKILICKGGLGGRGNFEFKSPRNTTPKYAQPGLPGEERHLRLTLKLIADYGLIGLPNAGKSSLLNELTSANVKTAEYPFTTLEPNLGVLDNKIIADIPGLIEGAAEGKGLGIKFLKHIEKVKLLLHCISSESNNPLEDYKTILNELKKFNPELVKKEEIIILTKTDLVDEKELHDKQKTLKQLKKKILTVSIHDWNSLQDFKELLAH